MPLSRAPLPSAAPLVVSGPGPTEPQAPSQPAPTPPSKSDSPSQSPLVATPSPPAVSNDHESDQNEGDEEEDQDDLPPSGQTINLDPYSNLDNAFGSYLADEPRPMKHGDEDDLLF